MLSTGVIPEKLKAFVFEQLKSEIAELHNDRAKVMAEKLQQT